MTIGERIRSRRIQLGMSQDELAKKLGYKSRSSINKIELNGRNLTQSKIADIAIALETTPDYIMGWNVETEKGKKQMRLFMTDDIMSGDPEYDLLRRISKDDRKFARLLKYAMFLESEGGDPE